MPATLATFFFATSWPIQVAEDKMMLDSELVATISADIFGSW
jgi:hypothetical protein